MVIKRKGKDIQKVPGQHEILFKALKDSKKNSGRQ